MFKKVLVAVDFSGPSLELLNAVDDLKKLGMEEMLIIHAIRMEAAGMGIGAHRKKFLNVVEGRCKELESDGCNINIIQPVGNPSEEIRRVAEEENADMILIGSIGEGSKVRELFLGSTVANVIRTSQKPVLIEKYDRTNKKQPVRLKIFPEDKLPTALLTTDFSRSSLKVYDFFLENNPLFKRVILMNVVDEGYTREQISENKEKAMEKLESWKEEFVEKGYDVEAVIEVGIPSEKIAKVAVEKDATMVCISRRGRGMINELLIGSTADPVVRHCPRPVLLLKN